MRTITLEEHYATPEFLDGPGRKLRLRPQAPGSPLANLLERLCDLGEKRIAEMDAAGVDVQVLSLTSPGVEQLEPDEAATVARRCNDRLAEAVGAYPGRLAGFATIPTAAPDQAAAELERTVRDLGFKGALINGHLGGRYLDDKFFWPIFERAEALRVPIYLHPTQPPQPVIDVSYGGFEPLVTDMLAGAGWGWHMETAVHIIRIIIGGVFDRFPNLQIVIGHMGEALPFMLERFENMPPSLTKLKKPIRGLLTRKCPLHFQWLQFSSGVFGLVARGRRRPHHVFGRPPVCLDGPGACLPR